MALAPGMKVTKCDQYGHPTNLNEHVAEPFRTILNNFYHINESPRWKQIQAEGFNKAFELDRDSKNAKWS